LRYYLLREVPFGADGTFTPESFVERINFDLANDLGNLLNRTIVMIDKYFNGRIQPYMEGATEFDADVLGTIKASVEKYEEAMEKMEFSIALSAIWTMISRTNKYIDETQPWALVKDEALRPTLGSVLYLLAESQRISAVLLQPFLTHTPQQIWAQLGLTNGALGDWDSATRFGQLPEGTLVQKGAPMFPRLDVAVETAYIAQAMGGAAASEGAPQDGAVQNAAAPIEAADAKEEIGIDDFAKLELRVAQVISAEPVKGADKLLKLQLNLGYEQRQVVSGIAKFYKPEELVGQKVILVANLKPVKLRGELSQGMILAASQGDRLTIASVPNDMPNGAIVK
jgi:methionyl-tRNA synthetase